MAEEQVIRVDLLKGLRIVRKRIGLLLFVPLLSVGLAYAACLYVLPVAYEASTTLLVSRAVSQGVVQYADMLVDQQLVKTYREIPRSDLVLEQVIRNLRLNMTLTELRELVYVTQPGETEVIRIAVQHKDPYGAAGIADAVAESFMTNILQIMKVENVAVVDRARVPQEPIKPNKLLVLVGIGFAGCLASVTLIVWLEHLNNTIDTTEDIAEHLGLPLLSAIPSIDPKLNPNSLITVGSEDAAFIPRRLSKRHPQFSGISEAYRTLRTNVQFYKNERPLRTILVTSAIPGEGKSTVLANLAVAFAQAGKSVISVDADLRRPTLHEVFGVKCGVGVSEALSRDIDMAEFLRITDRPLLRVVTSGQVPPNPSELLSLGHMEDLLKALAQQADVVLVDSPPLVSVTDAAILSQLVDGVILVAGSGMLPRKAAVEAVAQLKKLHAKCLGVVLNYAPDAPNSKYAR